MLNPEKLQAVKSGAVVKDMTTLENMPEEDLIRLRDAIDRLLPDEALGQVNLEHELLAQFRKVKMLQDDVIDDSSVAANQRAQVANSVVGTLGQLIKMQEDLKRAETLKLIEATLIECIKTLPEEVKTEFFDEYDRRATKAGLK